MFINLNWWTVLTVYLIIFGLMALLFQWVDFEKWLKPEGKKYAMLLYFTIVLIATFCIGTFILIIANLTYI